MIKQISLGPGAGIDSGTPTASTHSTSQTIPSNEGGKSSRTVAHLLVECLEKEGVRHVFGVPGEEIEDLLFALADSSIAFVPCRHEQGAAFIADVWGRLTGKAGVCLATLGPGATNLLTGVADANFDKAPLVAITGQGGLDRLHKVGNGLEPGVLQGLLIDEAAVEKAEDHISDAVSKGARVLLGGKRHSLGHTFFEPTVLADVTAKMKVAREETFGPVAPLFRFYKDEEVVQLSNDTEFGLASYFFGRDIGRIWPVADQLEYGMVGINTGLISTEAAPFGGIKQSGLGREGSHYGTSMSFLR
jgi:Aldehyde dehydrogenase family/Thiamine pyrophosphate enzyme, N-terminal TPP binding domain